MRGVKQFLLRNIDEDLWDKVSELAARQRISKTAWCIQALRNEVIRCEKMWSGLGYKQEGI